MGSLQNKKQSFVVRLVAANQQLLDVISTLNALEAEWTANGYATGAPPSGNNITDADLTEQIAYMTTTQLNSLIAAHVAVSDAVATNRGYLEAGRS